MHVSRARSTRADCAAADLHRARSQGPRGPLTEYEVEISLKNVGDKAAGPTTISVLLPQTVFLVRLRDEFGGTTEDTVAVTETLESSRGEEIAASITSLEVPHVRLRSPPLLFWVKFVAPDDKNVFPMRVKAASDDLPDDIEAEILDQVITQTF